MPANKRAVPAEDCLGFYEERNPALAGDKTGQEGDDGTVGPGEAGTGDLTAKHGQLVAEHEDLGILGRAI